MDDRTVKSIAAELHRAEQQRQQIEQLSKRYPQMTIDDGYRVSRAWVNIKRAEGRSVRGKKIGLTSRAMQQAAGITEPDYGTLLDNMVFAENGDIPFERFITPKVEAEIAFILARPLGGPGVTIFDVLAATAYVVPAIEIIDTRILAVDPQTGSTRKIQDTIADNAANAGIIVGGRPVKPDSIDLRWQGVILSKNSVIEETGLAAGVINHPANGVAWLANKLAPWGEPLEAGEILLGGSFIRPMLVSRGDLFHADYGRLGSFSFRFA